MGGRSSSLTSIDARCEWCGAATADAKPRGDFTVCSRCSGVVGRKKASGAGGGGGRRSLGLGASSGSRSTLGGDDEKAEVLPCSLPQPPLQLVHVLPFLETLPASDTAPTETQMLTQYLTPFFAARQGLYVTAGQRYQVKEVDFKITACFPPAGQMAATTVIRCMYPPLHALTELKRLHVLPTLASLPAGAVPPSSQNLFHDYLKPYFVPSTTSSFSSSSSSSSSSVPQHHLAVGDCFMSRGLQFKVIACVPSDGLVTTSCDIFVEGEALRDVTRVAILPIFESLPNNEKAITAEQVVERYLHPFFSGRFQVVGRNDSLDIDGVTFRVTACEPERGLVTMATQIFAEGEPLRAEELRRQQEVEDEELARRMQQQEAREQGYPMGPPMPFGGPLPGMIAPLSLPRRAPQPALANADELRVRLQELLRQMPEHDGHRIIIRRMLDTLPHNHGATKRDIDSLPTRVYVARTQPSPSPPPPQPSQAGDEKAEKKDSAGAAEESREHLMCMVCLSDYEQGEVLRTLPCFHSYHQGCIDEWLTRNKACPLCKNPIC